MKKLMSLLMAGVLMLGLVACGEDNSGTNANTGTKTGTAANSGTPNTHSGTGTTNTGLNTDRMGDYLNNNTTNTNFKTDGLGADYEPTGNAMRGKEYADSDYQHSGVTGANSITADM